MQWKAKTFVGMKFFAFSILEMEHKKLGFLAKNYRLDCEKSNLRVPSYFRWKKTIKVKLFIFSGNWMKYRILGKSFFWSEIFSAQSADLSSICSDVDFGETIFLMIVKIFESFRMFKSKKLLVYNKSKISFGRVVENENGIWRVQMNNSINFLLFFLQRVVLFFSQTVSEIFFTVCETFAKRS